MNYTSAELEVIAKNVLEAEARVAEAMDHRHAVHYDSTRWLAENGYTEFLKIDLGRLRRATRR